MPCQRPQIRSTRIQLHEMAMDILVKVRKILWRDRFRLYHITASKNVTAIIIGIAVNFKLATTCYPILHTLHI